MTGSLVLAFDTSSAVGHVALARGGEVLSRVVLEERGRHAPGLVPAIEEALAAAGIGRESIDGAQVHDTRPA